MTASRLLVTGASGQFGRLVLTELIGDLRVDPNRIIATTRNPDSLRAFADQGVEVRSADFDAPASLPSAFDGADRMLIIPTSDIVPAGLRSRQHGHAIDVAVARGVNHVVYTSAPNPSSRSPSRAGEATRRADQRRRRLQAAVVAADVAL